MLVIVLVGFIVLITTLFSVLSMRLVSSMVLSVRIVVLTLIIGAVAAVPSRCRTRGSRIIMVLVCILAGAIVLIGNDVLVVFGFLFIFELLSLFNFLFNFRFNVLFIFGILYFSGILCLFALFIIFDCFVILEGLFAEQRADT